MIRVQLKELYVIIPSLQSIMDKEVDITFAYKLGKMYKKLVEEYEILEENKMKLIEKYKDSVEVDDNGNQIAKFNDKNLGKYNSEIIKLINIEVEFNFEKIKISELQENNLKLTAKDLMNLDAIIE